jgi:hypothetical protein
MCVRGELDPDPISAETLPTMTATGFHEGASDVDERIMEANTEQEVRAILDEPPVVDGNV